jgi:hypothetical protein
MALASGEFDKSHAQERWLAGVARIDHSASRRRASSI